MRNTFNVLFYIKKNAPLRNGNVPIMGRITINGERTQFPHASRSHPNTGTSVWGVSPGGAMPPAESTNNFRISTTTSKGVTTSYSTSSRS